MTTEENFKNRRVFRSSGTLIGPDGQKYKQRMSADRENPVVYRARGRDDVPVTGVIEAFGGQRAGDIEGNRPGTLERLVANRWQSRLTPAEGEGEPPPGTTPPGTTPPGTTPPSTTTPASPGVRSAADQSLYEHLAGQVGSNQLSPGRYSEMARLAEKLDSGAPLNSQESEAWKNLHRRAGYATRPPSGLKGRMTTAEYRELARLAAMGAPGSP